MGNKTGFNLNDEIARWRSQMLARESISSENVRELETHLRDTVTRLTAGELSEEEAFFVAMRRLGTPEKLTEEFAKDDPTAKWRTRIFWMAAALFASQVLGAVFNTSFVWISNLVPSNSLSIGVSLRYLVFAFILPFFWPSCAAIAGYALLKGRLQGQTAKLARLPSSPKLLAGLLLVPILILACVDIAIISQNLRRLSSQQLANGMTVSISWMPGVIANFVWFTVLGLTVYLLAPGRRAKVVE